MAWSDAARRAALEARRRNRLQGRLTRIDTFMKRVDPKKKLENVYIGENRNRAAILRARIQAKLYGRKIQARLGLTDYGETSDTEGTVTVGPRRRLMKGSVTRSRTSFALPTDAPNRTRVESLGTLRGTSTRSIVKRARAIARGKKPNYHSPYS